MRFLSAAVALALAVPALAQPRVEAELDRLRAQIKELEAKLRASQPDKKPEPKPEVKKEERRIEIRVDEPKKGDGDKKPEIRVEIKKPDGEKKPEPRKDEPRGPMGGGFGGFGPMGGGMGGGFGPPWTRPDFSPPGFDKLTKDEQAMFRKLMEKMTRGGEPERKAEQPKPTPGNLEGRLERLERAIEEIRNQMNRGGQGGPGGPGRGFGPGGGGPGGPGGGGPGGPGGGRGPGR